MSYTIENPGKISGFSHTFAPLPNWLLSRKEISSNTKIIYARLLQYKGKKDNAYPSRQELADECGLEIKTVARGLHELRKNNLIFVERRGNARSNSYKFPAHPWMSDGKTYKSKSIEASATSIDKIEGTNLSPHNKIDGTDLVCKGGGDRTDMTHHDRTDLSPPYEKIIENKIVEEKRDFSTTSEKNYKKEFEGFWEEYPLKRHKKLTSTYFMEAMEVASFTHIMEKVRSYKRMAHQKGTEKFFISSHKWLEEERWNDCYGDFEKKAVEATQTLFTAPVAPDRYKASWEAISGKLKGMKGEAIHKSWFENLCLAEVEGDTATVHAASQFTKTWNETHFKNDILCAIQSVYPTVTHLKFRVLKRF